MSTHYDTNTITFTQPSLCFIIQRHAIHTLHKMMTTSLFLILLHVTLLVIVKVGSGGHWEVLQQSISIMAMHMQLLHTDRMVIFECIDFRLSNLPPRRPLPPWRCQDGRENQLHRPLPWIRRLLQHLLPPLPPNKCLVLLCLCHPRQNPNPNW